MIEINLLPGSARKSKGRKSGLSFGAVVSDAKNRVRDPYMLTAVGCVLVAGAAIGGLHVTQTARAATVAEREERAVADSTRFASVLLQRNRAIAKRDSVLSQLRVIRSIDENRFIWPHIMDEASRAMPPYTWLKSILVSTPQVAPQPAAPPSPGDSAAAPRDPLPFPEPMRFRVVGLTVDIQALTRFMKLLEASPFIQNVQLAKSEMVITDGKELTEFTLDAEYERPDKSAITTAPVSLSVR